ncbi:hypothetical protein VTH06DRAFT_7593 [Thermothelomyces fergusii]
MLLGFFYALLWAPLISFYAVLAGAEEDSLLIECYRWDGEVVANNTKCPNSNACCGPTATCLSNRLCHKAGDPPDLFVRGPCAVSGWDPECAQICQYNEAFDIFPRVKVCADGSLCCDNNKQCCEEGKGIFLDESGNVVSTRATAATTSYPPIGGGPSRYTLTPSTSTTTTTTTTTTSPTTDSSSSSSISASAVTTSTIVTQTTAIDGEPSGGSSSTDDGDDGGSGGGDHTTGFKIGLGLGIPLTALVTGVAVYFLTKRLHRSPPAGAATAATTTANGDGSLGPHYNYPPPPEQPQPQYAVPGPQSSGLVPTYYSLGSTANLAGTAAAGQQQQQQPVEAPCHMTAELDAAALNGAVEKGYDTPSGQAPRGWYATGGQGGVATGY